MSTIRSAAIAASIAVGLAACGGGGGKGGGGGVAANTPPASASASVQGFVSYLQGIVATRSESAEPVDLSGFVAPSSDTDEPAQI